MIRIYLFYLNKNYRGKQKDMLRELCMPRSTFNSIITGRSTQIKFAQANTILHAVESLRNNSTVDDASLLLPINISPYWRWAVRDVHNNWHLFNSPSPPKPTPAGWAFPGYIGDPRLQLDRTLISIPPDTDPFNNHLYQRDPVSGLWRKTYRPEPMDPSVQKTRQLTEQEIRQRCLWFTDPFTPKEEAIKDILI